jgi:hypothetical protein
MNDFNVISRHNGSACSTYTDPFNDERSAPCTCRKPRPRGLSGMLVFMKVSTVAVTFSYVEPGDLVGDW